MQTVLVTGGAGYIGSHVVHQLLVDDYRVVVVDNLERGHFAAIPERAEFYKTDINDTDELEWLLNFYRVGLVMHFASYAYVGESFKQSFSYWDNNVAGTFSLIEAMLKADIHNFIFSSSCATYGNHSEIITEETPQNPINPYGQTKLAIEQMLKSMAISKHQMAIVALRYFNAAGCDDMAGLGEDHRPETHLIPCVLRSIYNQEEGFPIYGGNYDTPDGTCVRDYTHVVDLASAHLQAVMQLARGKFKAYNLGTGKGHSVLEVIKACEEVTGKEVDWRISKKRPGDPDSLVASNQLAELELGWIPEYTDLVDIVGSTWNWMLKNPLGYKSVRAPSKRASKELNRIDWDARVKLKLAEKKVRKRINRKFVQRTWRLKKQHR